MYLSVDRNVYEARAERTMDRCNDTRAKLHSILRPTNSSCAINITISFTVQKIVEL